MATIPKEELIQLLKEPDVRKTVCSIVAEELGRGNFLLHKEIRKIVHTQAPPPRS